jgi:hypothetical protein
VKKRAGIFDPWRQSEQPALDETPSRKTPAEFSVDETVTQPQHCIQFNGLRAGVYVWLVDRDDDDSARARATLVSLVHRLSAREGIAKILHGWGVYTGTPKYPNVVVLADGEKKMTISVPVDDDRLVLRAIDSFALALREVAQQFPDVRDTLVALRIRPYVK